MAPIITTLERTIGIIEKDPLAVDEARKYFRYLSFVNELPRLNVGAFSNWNKYFEASKGTKVDGVIIGIHFPYDSKDKETSIELKDTVRMAYSLEKQKTPFVFAVSGDEWSLNSDKFSKFVFNETSWHKVGWRREFGFRSSEVASYNFKLRKRNGEPHIKNWDRVYGDLTTNLDWGGFFREERDYL